MKKKFLSKSLFILIFIELTLTGTASAESAKAAPPDTRSVRVYASDWATVVKRDGQPVNVWPDGKRLAAGVWARTFWGEAEDAYAYLKFDLPEPLRGLRVRRATFHGYVSGQYNKPYPASVWTEYLAVDDWTRQDVPFPFYALESDSPVVATHRAYGRAVKQGWIQTDLTSYLRQATEGAGHSLTLQLRRGLPGRRGWTMTGPGALQGQEPDPRRPYVEIEYFVDPQAFPPPELLLSRGEKWHRRHGLFFAGWMSPPLTDDNLAPYRELYPYAFVGHPSPEDREKLRNNGLPWMAMDAPSEEDRWPGSPVLRIGSCLDEDVLFKRDRGLNGRVEHDAAAVVQLRKTHPDLLVLVGLHAWNRSAGAINLTTALDMDVPAGEVYPFLHGQDRYGHYFSQLTWARDAGQACRKPYWVFTQTFGHEVPTSAHDSVRLPSESELRLQIFAALTWGYQGFIDFMYNTSGYPNMALSFFDAEGQLTPDYEVQKQAIREALHLGRGLSQLRNTQVAFLKHTPPGEVSTPSWKELLKGLPVHSLECSHGDLTLGRFVDDWGHEDYLMLCNLNVGRDISIAEGTTQVTLVLAGTKTLRELDRRTGDVVVHELGPIAGEVDRYQHQFSLPGGTGTLFKLGDGERFPLLASQSE